MKGIKKLTVIVLSALVACSLLAACARDDTDYTKVIPAGSFRILSPTDGQKDAATSLVVRWTEEPNANTYHIEIFEGDTLAAEYKESGTEKTVVGALKHGTQYTLRVTAVKMAEETVALARQSVSFTTIAAHDTQTPDYTQSRALYDFEDYADDAALRADFTMHTAGDTAGLSLGEGVNASKALKIEYTAGVNGWAGVLNSLRGSNKVWSGAKGIRLWVKGGGVGSKLEIRFGKRGYQSWAATFTVNRAEGMYVSIPFSAFEDIGGGDGILDLSGITRLWFFVTGTRADTLIIDDVSVGSDEAYTTDTRAAIERPYAAELGVFDDFESYADDAALESVWGFENMGGWEVLSGAAAMSGSRSLGVTPNASWATAYADMPATDFGSVTSIYFRAAAGTYVIQLVSGFNVVEKEVVSVVDGDSVGANLADFAPQNAAMTDDVSRVDRLVIGVKDKNDALVPIDDITFSDEIFTPKDYTPKVGMADDFEGYADDAEMEAVWKFESMGNYTLTKAGAFEGETALELSPQAAWATASRGYPSVDFSGITSIRFKATAGAYVLQLVAAGGTNVYESDITVEADGDEAGANIADLTPRFGEVVDVRSIGQLVVGVKDKSGGVAVIDALYFSGETYTPPDRTAGAIEDFETIADVAAMWTTGGAATLSLETEAPLAGGASLRVASNMVGDVTMQKAYFEPYDFTATTGFRFKIRSNHGVKLTVQVGSYGNVYTMDKQIYGDNNNVSEVVVEYAAMKLADGNTGELDKTKIDYLRLFFTQYNADYVALLDDFTFFTADNHTPGVRALDDFDGYADSAALIAAWHNNNLTLSGDADKSMTLSTVHGWNGLQYNFPNPAVGTETDYQNCYAIVFDVHTDKAIDLQVSLQRWTVRRTFTVSLNAGGNTVKVYFNSMTGDAEWSDMAFSYLIFGTTDYASPTTVTIDNVAFLIG